MTILACWLSACALVPVQDPGAPARLDSDGLNAALAALAAEQPGRVQLTELGRSRTGRAVQAARIGEGAPRAGRPALLLVAGLEGPQDFTSTLALEIARALARGQDDATRALLADTTVYVVPRLDADAGQARFETPLSERRASGTDADDDRDGRLGEDPPQDVDGDGLIAWMRKVDPEGEWILDPHDARALRRADKNKGERGRYKHWPEGRDLDRDERAAEDAPLNAELARNFPAQWREHEPESGRFATDEPLARALCDFVLAHPDIAAVVTWGEIDTLVEKPRAHSGDDDDPKGGWLAADLELQAELQQLYKDVTGNSTAGSKEDAGTFQAWCYSHRGLWTLAARPWDIPLEAKKKPDGGEKKPDGVDEPKESEDAPAVAKPRGEPSQDAQRLAWIDANGESARFLPWRAFEHPELGTVEIGGLAPFARTEPPLAEREALIAKQLAFVQALGVRLPRVKLASFEAELLGADLWRLEAAIENDAPLPFQSAAALRARSQRPLRATLAVAADALVAGERVTLVRELAASGGRRELRWLVRASSLEGIELELDSDHAGRLTASPEVKR